MREDGLVMSKLEDCEVVGSPLKLHDYLADLQLSPSLPSSSNFTVASHQPVSISDARSVSMV